MWVESVMKCCVPFRFEGIRVRPHIRVTMESVNRYGDNHSFRDDHPAYFHTAVRHPFNPITNRVQPQWLRDHHVQVLHLHQLVISWLTLEGDLKAYHMAKSSHLNGENKSLSNLPGKGSVDLHLQFLLDMWVERQIVGCKCHWSCHVIITNNGKYQGLNCNLLISQPCNSDTSQ